MRIALAAICQRQIRPDHSPKEAYSFCGFLPAQSFFRPGKISLMKNPSPDE
jgi:hypothetical protein